MADNSKTVIFKNHLKELMHEKYITKAQFCRDIEISKPTLDKWLNIDNDILPTLANTLRIAEKYNVSIDWLTGNEVAPVNDNSIDDVDMVKLIFETIAFLDEHCNTTLKTAYLGKNILYPEFCAKIEIKDEIIAYFIQEYNRIKPIITDENMKDFKGVIWERFIQKFIKYTYDKETKTIKGDSIVLDKETGELSKIDDMDCPF